MEKWKKTIVQFFICVGLLCVIWGGHFYVMEKLDQRIERVLEDDFSWVVQVDEVWTKNNELVIKGFAFELDKEASAGAFDIVLYNLDTNEYLFPKMEYMNRKDVNDYFQCEYDYTKSGFVAKIKEKELNLEEHDYEILLLPDWTHNPYQFNTYLSDGEIMYTNPKEYIPLDVEGTDLEMIVENGTLRVYEPENHIYVYQYEGELYWIADDKYGFADEDICVQYHLNTTQVERLPIHRLMNGWNWDNISFMFSENEIDSANTGKYRVTQKKVPTEYSIEKIWTGNYIESWIWKEEFRPRYEF